MPRALPVRSGGPATSRTSSSSWNASPISRPKTSSGPGRRRLALEADQAGALEQARGLQATALEVALGADLELEGVVALGELAAGEADRGAGEQGDLALGALLRPRRARRRRVRTAGRRRPSPPGGRRGRPRSGCRAEAAPRRARRRGRASPCGRARSRSRRESRPSPASAPAQTRTSIGRRRLPPAARVAPASAASRSPPSAVSSPSRASTAAIRRGSQDSAASRTRVTGGGTGASVHVGVRGTRVRRGGRRSGSR